MTSAATPVGGSTAAAADGYLFKVQVLEGRGFGAEPQALLCCAAFAGKCNKLILQLHVCCNHAAAVHVLAYTCYCSTMQCKPRS
jgi:hypothetical protein